MRKDSALIFGISVLITIGIVGGAYYMNVVWQPQAQNANDQPAPSTSQLNGNSAATQANEPRWTDQPIKCFNEEYGEFWTNAKNCESADLKNRLSIAQPVQKVDYISPNANEVRRKIHSSAQRKSDKKPSLRQVANSVPSGLGVSCKFAVGRAQEIERSLSAANNPAESVWRENYCRWIKEAKSCGVSMEYFYYPEICLL